MMQTDIHVNPLLCLSLCKSNKKDMHSNKIPDKKSMPVLVGDNNPQQQHHR